MKFREFLTLKENDVFSHYQRWFGEVGLDFPGSVDELVAMIGTKDISDDDLANRVEEIALRFKMAGKVLAALRSEYSEEYGASHFIDGDMTTLESA
ncbi:hypothetical protein ACX3P0_05790 [Mesorhizobium sp. A556]